MGKPSINGPFSMAMLNNQRVNLWPFNHVHVRRRLLNYQRNVHPTAPIPAMSFLPLLNHPCVYLIDKHNVSYNIAICVCVYISIQIYIYIRVDCITLYCMQDSILSINCSIIMNRKHISIIFTYKMCRYPPSPTSN